MKRSLCLFFILVLSLSSVNIVAAEMKAAEVKAAQSESLAKYEKEAEQLHALGLFRGTSSGFDLESKPTRAQGAVMLVRLLGKEELAEEKGYTHPFIDVPSWANAHVGYLYEFGLTTGMSIDRFGSDEQLLSIHYATFILRALGYDDSQGDFVWHEAVDKLVDINLIDSNISEELNSHIFLRDHVVLLSHKALEIPMKDSTTRLIDKLIDEGAVSEHNANQVGLFIEEEVDYEKINTFRNHMEYEFKKGPVKMEKVFEYFDEGVPAYDLYEIALKYDEDLDVFEQIVSKVGEVDAGLHMAIFYENVPVVKLLLKNGVDVDVISKRFPTGYRPLMTAMSIGNYYIYEKGSGRRTMVDRKSDTSELVNLLLSSGAAITADVMTKALLGHQTDFVKTHFFKAGFNVNSEGPMYIDLNRDGSEIAPGVVLWTKSIFAEDVKESKSMFMQLIYESFHGGIRYELIEFFVQHGAELDDSLSQEQLDFFLSVPIIRQNALLYDFFINAGAIDPYPDWVFD